MKIKKYEKETEICRCVGAYMDFSRYNTAKENICEQVKNLQHIAQTLGMNEHYRQLKNVCQRLNDDHFNLVVVGMFSRGKSTFIDALLGRRILPTSKKPTTAVISRIIYGDTPRYTLHFKDSTIADKTLNEDEFRSLTAPKSPDKTDKEQIKKVLRQQDELDTIAEAEIAYPLHLCKNGVDLVDTPGMNDVNRTRIELTYRYLRQADAVIMLLAADQMLSVSEVDFLKERILSRQIKDVFYIINRKDALSGPEEESKVVTFAHRNLKEIIPPELANELRIFLLSSYQALLFRRRENGDELTAKQLTKIPVAFSDTGFPEFEKSLSDFLIHEKGQSKLDSYRLQTRRQIDDMTAKIEDALGLLEHSLDEILEKSRELEPEFKQARTKSKSIIDDMQMNLECYTNYIKEQCQVAGDDMLVAACGAVDNYRGELDSTRLKQEINEAVAQQQKNFIDGMIQYQNTALQGELTKAQKRLQEIWQDVDAQYRLSLNLPAISNNNSISIATSQPNVISDDRGIIGSCAVGGSIGALLAGAVFPALAIGAMAAWCFGFFDNQEEKVKQNIKKQLMEQIPKMLNQIQKDVVSLYRARSEELITVITNTVESRISDMENVLEQIIHEKENQEHEQKQRKEFLKKSRGQLMAIKNKLSVFFENMNYREG